MNGFYTGVYTRSGESNLHFTFFPKQFSVIYLFVALYISPPLNINNSQVQNAFILTYENECWCYSFAVAFCNQLLKHVILSGTMVYCNWMDYIDLFLLDQQNWADKPALIRHNIRIKSKCRWAPSPYLL